jgi:hypothetical protein
MVVHPEKIKRYKANEMKLAQNIIWPCTFVISDENAVMSLAFGCKGSGELLKRLDG